MTNFLPDQSFYPSPQMAMQAVPEKLAYVAMLNPNPSSPDAMAVVDLDPASKVYGKVIHQLDMPNAGDELHHFGWNACSSCLCPYSPHPHMERRFWWFRECVRRAFTFSIPSPTRESQNWSR